MALHLRVMDNIEHAWGFSCCIGLTRMQILLSAIGHTPPTEPAKQATVQQPGYFSKKKKKTHFYSKLQCIPIQFLPKPNLFASAVLQTLAGTLMKEQTREQRRCDFTKKDLAGKIGPWTPNQQIQILFEFMLVRHWEQKSSPV